MKIVGVIDLLDGRAVHARGGNRARYAPVTDAELSIPAGDAMTLARAYLEHFGLSDLYVADLDAILGRPLQTASLHALADLGLTLWADTGVRSVDDARAAQEAGAARIVVGLETLPSFEVLDAIGAALGGDKVAFSLDLRDGAPIVAEPALARGRTAVDLAREAVGHGAGTLIVLDLARVGMGTGVDVSLVTDIRNAVPHAGLFAGGGVRGVDDLVLLASAGCDGALVASALLEGRLTRVEIARTRER